jgi:hypothetical protein
MQTIVCLLQYIGHHLYVFLTRIDFYFEGNKLIKIFEANIDYYFESNAGKGTRDFNPLGDYRFFHHWFSGVKTP